MTDKQNFEIKETFIYGCKLLTGKLIDYEFVKLDFDKDIDVPSKLLDSNLTRADLCILINDLHIERIGKNKQLKAKEQECETLASQLDFEVQKKECLEQECERLKKIIDEAQNSKLDLKSFLVGEAIQNEYEQQLDQLKEQLEAYKMEAEEGKEINAELKAENEKLKQYKEVVDKLAGMQVILTNENGVPQLYDNAKDLKLKQHAKALTEIKEIALKSDMPPCLDIDCKCEYCKDEVTNKGFNCMQYGLEQILQKISEVEDV